jgi:hypothetical protein
MILAGGALFVVSAAGYLYVKIRLRPRREDVEEVYWEFEDQVTGPYEKWSRRAFAGVVLAMVLIFLGAVL